MTQYNLCFGTVTPGAPWRLCQQHSTEEGDCLGTQMEKDKA